MKTKTLITTAALIGACSLFAATSAIAASEIIDSDRPTLNGDGGIKTFENGATVGTYTQTANTTFSGTGTIANGINTGPATFLTIAANADITITGTYQAATGHTAALAGLTLSNNANLKANNITANYALWIKSHKDSVLDVNSLEFSGGGGNVGHTFIQGNNANDAGTVNAGEINVRNGVTLVVANGVRLNLGSGGIKSEGVNAGRYTIQLGNNGATLGTTASWGSSLRIALMGNTTFDPSAGQSITLSGVVSGAGRLAKTGAGDLILDVANTYSGGTVISAGTLVAGHNNALGTGTITVQNGGALEIATGVVLNAAKGVTLEAGSKLVIDMSGHAGVQDVVLDILTIGAGQEFKVGDTIVTAQNVNSVLEGFYELTGGRWDFVWEYTDGKLSLAGAAIPEPSTFGLLAGLGALALVASRRRRSRKAA